MGVRGCGNAPVRNIKGQFVNCPYSLLDWRGLGATQLYHRSRMVRELGPLKRWNFFSSPRGRGRVSGNHSDRVQRTLEVQHPYAVGRMAIRELPLH